MKSHKAIWTLVVLLLIAAMAAGAIFALADTGESVLPESETGSETISSEEEWGSTIIENGVTYRLDPALKTVLFLGVDDGGSRSETIAGSGGRADTVMVLILNDEKKTVTLLSISRDTMTEVDAYGTDGSYAYSSVTHINMQYAYGDSPARSAYLMKKTVSELLYGTRIDGYLSLESKGIREAVDALGGLRLTMPEDYSDIDPKYEKGVDVILSGEETERLLRYRDTRTVGSNETRVERHLRLIEAVFRELGGRIGVTKLREIMDAAGDAISSDLDAETLKKLASYSLEEEVFTLPGTVREGEDHDEFYVDETALRKLLIGLFYKPTES